MGGRAQQFQPATYTENITEGEQADEVAQYSKLLGSIKSDNRTDTQQPILQATNEDLDQSVIICSPVSTSQIQPGCRTTKVTENKSILHNLEEYLANSNIQEVDGPNKSIVGILKNQYLSPKSQNQTLTTIRSISQSKSTKMTDYPKTRSQSVSKSRSTHNRSATRNIGLSKVYTQTCFSRKKSMPSQHVTDFMDKLIDVSKATESMVTMKSKSIKKE